MQTGTWKGTGFYSGSGSTAAEQGLKPAESKGEKSCMYEDKLGRDETTNRNATAVRAG